MDKNRSKTSESLKIALWHLQQTQNTYFEHKIDAGQWPAREKILGSQTNILPTFRCTSPNLQHQLLGGALSIVIVSLSSAPVKVRRRLDGDDQRDVGDMRALGTATARCRAATLSVKDFEVSHDFIENESPQDGQRRAAVKTGARIGLI